MISLRETIRSATNKMVLLLLLQAMFCVTMAGQEPDYAQYIDPMIGTSGNSHTFPGPSVPWGMVKLTPHGNGGSVGGFHAFSNRVYGFVHTNVSGPGCSGWGNLPLMATNGEILTDKEEYASEFWIGSSSAHAGYFRTTLHSYRIEAELTSTKRVGMTRFTFPAQAGDANIFMHVSGGVTSTENAFVEVRDDSTLVGYKYGGDFCGIPTKETTYFFARISKPMLSSGVWLDGEILSGDQRRAEGQDVGGFMRFATEEGEQITVKVGISYVSIDNAQLNLETELPHWDFEQVADDAYQEWNETISRIEVEDANTANKTKFYTGIYHSLLHPNLFNDVNGEYPDVSNGGVKKAEGFSRYTLFSLWDTYRTVHPFLTLMYPEQQNDMVQSMIEHYKEAGALPRWEISGTDVLVMLGDPANIVITDTYNRGLRGFDVDLAYAAIRHHSFMTDNDFVGRPENGTFTERGYIPYSSRRIFFTDAGVSLAQEYCLADAGAALMAADLCKTQDVKFLAERSKSFAQSFDPDTKFFRPRMPSGEWMTPFDPTSDQHSFNGGHVFFGGPGFTEGSAWNYRFFVPHAQPELMQLMGGAEDYVTILRRYFSEEHFFWNQHNLAYPFLFNYAPGQQWRSVEQVHALRSNAWNTEISGVPDNDDAGGLSSWHTFAALGLYPDNPGTPSYLIASPLFDKVTLHLDDRYYPGKTFVITAAADLDSDIYLDRVELNGQEFRSGKIDHAAIVAGGTFDFVLRDSPADVLNMPPTTAIEPAEQMQGYDPTAFELRILNPLAEETLQVQISLDITFCEPIFDREFLSPNELLMIDSLPFDERLHIRVRYIREGAMGDWSELLTLQTLPDSTLGLPVESNISIFEFGPNPVQGNFHLSMMARETSELQLSVFNSIGELMMQEQLAVEPFVVFDHTLDFRKFANGSYQIKVAGGDHSTSVTVVVLR